MTESFDELLQEELSRPIELKQNGHVVARITPLAAMVKSLVTKAGKGDMAAISVISNFTRPTTEADKDRERLRREQTDKFYESLKRQFERENLYDGQDEELRILAETRYMLDLLSQRTQTADFEPLVTEYTPQGGTRTTKNPLIDMQKEVKKQFETDLARLRKEAMQRVITRKQLKL